MAPPVQWNRIPPCLAHTILKEMFENKKIQSDDPPAKIYDLHDEFKKFITQTCFVMCSMSYEQVMVLDVSSLILLKPLSLLNIVSNY